jgi:hypothetical protein
VPTYAYRCATCGRVDEHVMSIHAYVSNAPAFYCCAAQMPRFISVAPGVALGNALASERHYDGLRAPDGTPIDTRAKHREYMRANNLTTVDDFAGTWKRDAEQREARLAGVDPARARDVADAVTKHGG